MCIKNISNEIGKKESDFVHCGKGSDGVQPLPVRLESLQLLATITKRYFALVRPNLKLMCDVVQRCLQDSDPAVQLHGSKVRNESEVALPDFTSFETEMVVRRAQL